MKFMLKTLTLLIITSQITLAQYVNVQGVIRDNSSYTIPDGNYTIVFKLYNHLTAGNMVWTETQTLSLVNGVYGAELGTGTSFVGGNTFWDDQYWLEIASIDGVGFSTTLAKISCPKT